jgi:hypothetical protein
MGTYVVMYHTIYSTVSNPQMHETSRWTATPKCHTPPCQTLIQSSNDWKSKAQLVRDHYRWALGIRDYYFCQIGSQRTEIDATGEYSAKPTAMRLVDNVWVVSRFSGQVRFTGHKSGGCSPLPKDRVVVSGVLKK